MRTFATALIFVVGTFLTGACGSKSLGVGANARVATDGVVSATPTPTITDTGASTPTPTPTPTPSASPSPTPDVCMGFAATYMATNNCSFGGNGTNFKMSFEVKAVGANCVATSLVAGGNYDDTILTMGAQPQGNNIHRANDNQYEIDGKLVLTAVGKFRFTIHNSAAGGALKVCEKP